MATPEVPLAPLPATPLPEIAVPSSSRRRSPSGSPCRCPRWPRGARAARDRHHAAGVGGGARPRAAAVGGGAGGGSRARADPGADGGHHARATRWRCPTCRRRSGSRPRRAGRRRRSRRDARRRPDAADPGRGRPAPAGAERPGRRAGAPPPPPTPPPCATTPSGRRRRGQPRSDRHRRSGGDVAGRRRRGLAGGSPVPTGSPALPRQPYARQLERPLAVLVDNVGGVAQSGLRAASTVFEMPVEAGLTRLMLVFDRTDPERVGPVRSAREYFVELAARLDAVLVHDGGSPGRAGRDRGVAGAHLQRLQPRRAVQPRRRARALQPVQRRRRPARGHQPPRPRPRAHGHRHDLPSRRGRARGQHACRCGSAAAT
jgi:hypothetical protein